MATKSNGYLDMVRQALAYRVGIREAFALGKAWELGETWECGGFR